MSQLAQKVQQQINELRRRPAPRRRPAVDLPEPPTIRQNAKPAPENSENTDSTTDATDELAHSATTAQHPPTEGEKVLTTTRARKTGGRKRPSARKATAARGRSPRHASRSTSRRNGGSAWEPGHALPEAGSLRLARNGVAAGDGSTIRLSFANGYGVTLKVGGADDPIATRDHLVTWLRKRLGADRA